jgi:hypothetical protein
LQAAVDHEAREEEADKQRRLELDAALVGSGRLGKAQEEQEPAEEQGRVVRRDHRPRHERQVRGCQPPGTGGNAMSAPPVVASSGTSTRARRRAAPGP